MEKLENVIGKEEYSRLLEVLNILGAKLPEKYNVDNGRISLVENPNIESENYIDFHDKDMIKIIFQKDGLRYFWYRLNCDGSIQEELDFDYGRLTATYFETNEATTTSGFYLSNDTWGSPKIYSDITSVSIGAGEKKKTFPIEDYYDVFTTYMNSKKMGYHNHCDLTDNPKVIDTIIRMFGRQIKDHVADLKSNDQSWRFESENKRIIADYKRNVSLEQQIYSETITEAEERLSDALNSSEKLKNHELQELAELQQKYGYGEAHK